MKRRSLIAGNWKMNGTRETARVLAGAIASREGVDIVICPPFVHLSDVSAPGVDLGAQDVSIRDNGAFTGDISAAMLVDMGCKYVIVGHSERRQHHNESDADVCAKATASIAGGLIPIICVGESRAQREGGQTINVIEEQVIGSIPVKKAAGDTIVVAYEPVWAIGTGLTATTEQIAQVHAQIRGLLVNRLANGQQLRILYGGSVNPSNAAEILALDDVDGALVGGASLKPESFLEIINAVKV